MFSCPGTACALQANCCTLTLVPLQTATSWLYHVGAWSMGSLAIRHQFFQGCRSTIGACTGREIPDMHMSAGAVRRPWVLEQRVIQPQQRKDQISNNLQRSAVFETNAILLKLLAHLLVFKRAHLNPRPNKYKTNQYSREFNFLSYFTVKCTTRKCFKESTFQWLCFR